MFEKNEDPADPYAFSSGSNSDKFKCIVKRSDAKFVKFDGGFIFNKTYFDYINDMRRDGVTSNTIVPITFDIENAILDNVPTIMTKKSGI